MKDSSNASDRERMFTFKGGGWVLAVAAVPTLAIVIWALAPIVMGTAASNQQGDGKNVDSYGFDLSEAIVDRDTIVVGSPAKDSIKALVQPAMISPADVERINEQERGKYLVDSDRVIGVVIDGVSRAYPLRMLEWHEIVNDVVAGEPIVVTYNGLCDSVAVFDARVGEEALPREFGVSGLLRNSNLLMYDRQEDENDESLWSQIDGRAVAGPAAAKSQTLQLLPSVVMHWDDWKLQHPQTEVMAPNPDPLLEKYYKRRTYGKYSSSDVLRFPVDPLPQGSDRSLKDRVVAVHTEQDGWIVMAIDDLEQRINANNVETMQLSDDSTLTWHFSAGDIPAVWATDEAGNYLPSVHAFWFAWYAAHPDLTLE